MLERVTDKDILNQIKLAKSYFNDKKYDEAILIYKELTAKVPDKYSFDKSEIYRNLGNCYYYLKDFEKAIPAYEENIRLHGDSITILNMLGYLYFYIDRDKSVENYLKTMAIKPDIRHFVMLTQVLIKDRNFSQKNLKEIFERYVDIFRPEILGDTKPFQYNPEDYDKNKKLRIGYLSSDFHCHAMMTFVLPILENHNQELFDICLYSCDKKSDSTTTRIKTAIPNFYDCKDLTNEELAKKIHNDKIDILVDLSGYTHNAVWSLIYKPAPIICQYLGFVGTYGMKEVDYILTDKLSIPEEMAKYYTEKPLYIECGMNRFTFNSKGTKLPAISELPYEKNGYVTFGSFNCMSKINKYTVNLWSKILKKDTDAKLLFYRTQMNEYDIKRLKRQFAECGITEDRLQFRNDKMKQNHFNCYSLCDIALDPTPFSGLTITIEQALMGIPTLTLPWETIASKGAARVNTALEMDGMIAKDDEDFVQIGADIKNHMDEIRWLRQNLRKITLNSPICRGYKQYTETIEKCYVEIWQHFCNNNP